MQLVMRCYKQGQLAQTLCKLVGEYLSSFDNWCSSAFTSCCYKRNWYKGPGTAQNPEKGEHTNIMRRPGMSYSDL
jgi:hypothetical protein